MFFYIYVFDKVEFLFVYIKEFISVDGVMDEFYWKYVIKVFLKY